MEENMYSTYQMEMDIANLLKWKESVDGLFKNLSKTIDKTNDIWSDKDLCRNWKISQRTASTLREKGEIEFLKIGGKIFYSREMRENYINKNSFKNEERN